jgi:hypothetical protein
MTSVRPKIKSAPKGRRFQYIVDVQQQRSDNGTESYSTTGVPKMSSFG